MQCRLRLAVGVGLALLLLASPALLAQVDALVDLPSKTFGSIDGPTDVAVIRFEALAGTKCSATVKGYDGFTPTFSLMDLQAADSVPFPKGLKGVGKTKVKAKGVILPQSGLYELLISGWEGSYGEYKLSLKGKIPKSAKSMKTVVFVEPGETEEIGFESLAKRRLVVRAKPTSKSDAEAEVVEVLGPFGPINLAGEGGDGKVSNAVLDAFGAYRLRVHNPSSMGGEVKVKVKIKKLKKGQGESSPGILVGSAAGFLDVPASYEVQPDELRATTLLGELDLGAGGTFALDIPQSTVYEPIQFVEKATNKPVYVGLYDPALGVVQADTQSTACSLLLLNPYLLNVDQAQRQQYLDTAQSTAAYVELVEALEAAFIADGGNALDGALHPEVYVAAAETIQAAMNATEFLGPPSIGSAPWMEDVPGSGVNVVNPRFVFYAVGVADGDEEWSHVVPIERKTAIVDVSLWPPGIGLSPPAETEYLLGNGYFEVLVTKGKVSKLLELGDPEALAAQLNAAQAIISVAEIALGVDLHVGLNELVELAHMLQLEPELAAQLGSAFQSGDGAAMTEAAIAVIDSQASSVIVWLINLFQEEIEGITADFVKGQLKLVKNLVAPLKVLDMLNEEGAFFIDLALAPGEATLFVKQVDGVVTSWEEDHPPVAQLVASPDVTAPNEPVVLDPTGSFDAFDPISELSCRWDIESDGSWETDWQPLDPITVSFESEGQHPVTLEVKDTSNLSSLAYVIVVVEPEDEPLEPTLAVSPASGPQLTTTFFVSGTNYTPNGEVERWVKKPGDSGFGQIDPITADIAGTIAWTFEPDCSHPVGSTYIYAVDVETGASSDTEVQEVTANAACDEPTTYLILPPNIEVNEGAGSITFTIIREGALPAETLYISTVQCDGFANAGDYIGKNSEPLDFAEGEASRTVTVEILDDAEEEADETFCLILQLNASDPIWEFLDEVTFTILNDDVGVTTYTITPPHQNVGEGAGVANFTVNRSGPLPFETVYFSTVQTYGATNIGDYVGKDTEPLSLGVGQASQSVPVTIFNDAIVEPDETFGVILQRNASDPIWEYLAEATFTILDDDVVSTDYTITPPSQQVGEGAGAANFVVNRAGSLPAETVYFSTVQTYGANNLGDYAGQDSEPLSFGAGQVSKSVPVTIFNDAIVEPDETFGVIVQRNADDAIWEYLAEATFTILNDDVGVTTYTITPPHQNVGEGAGVASFTVNRSGPLPTETIYFSTVQTYGTNNLSDYAGQDSEPLSFGAGQVSQSVPVTIFNDAIVEPDETFGVIVQRNASDPIWEYLAEATFTILDDDVVAPTVSVTPSVGFKGQVFQQPGTGFTPNGTADLYFRKPSGVIVNVFDKPVDGFGNYVNNYDSSTADETGVYQYWAIDDATGLQSNVFPYTIL